MSIEISTLARRDHMEAGVDYFQKRLSALRIGITFVESWFIPLRFHLGLQSTECGLNGIEKW